MHKSTQIMKESYRKRRARCCKESTYILQHITKTKIASLEPKTIKKIPNLCTWNRIPRINRGGNDWTGPGWWSQPSIALCSSLLYQWGHCLISIGLTNALYRDQLTSTDPHYQFITGVNLYIWFMHQKRANGYGHVAREPASHWIPITSIINRRIGPLTCQAKPEQWIGPPAY
jgi:hypothetical protein